MISPVHSANNSPNFKGIAASEALSAFSGFMEGDDILDLSNERNMNKVADICTEMSKKTDNKHLKKILTGLATLGTVGVSFVIYKRGAGIASSIGKKILETAGGAINKSEKASKIAKGITEFVTGKASKIAGTKGGIKAKELLGKVGVKTLKDGIVNTVAAGGAAITYATIKSGDKKQQIKVDAEQNDQIGQIKAQLDGAMKKLTEIDEEKINESANMEQLLKLASEIIEEGERSVDAA